VNRLLGCGPTLSPPRSAHHHPAVDNHSVTCSTGAPEGSRVILPRTRSPRPGSRATSSAANTWGNVTQLSRGRPASTTSSNSPRRRPESAPRAPLEPRCRSRRLTHRRGASADLATAARPHRPSRRDRSRGTADRVPVRRRRPRIRRECRPRRGRLARPTCSGSPTWPCPSRRDTPTRHVVARSRTVWPRQHRRSRARPGSPTTISDPQRATLRCKVSRGSGNAPSTGAVFPCPVGCPPAAPSLCVKVPPYAAPGAHRLELTRLRRQSRGTREPPSHRGA
jgi:hypothetical protein